MTTITLEVPDELATQFKVDPDTLPSLIREAISAKFSKLQEADEQEAESPVYDELIEFLSSSPTTEQIVKFKISPDAQERLEDLLYKNREAVLSQSEKTELATYLQLSHLVTRLKARARKGQPFIN